MDRVLVYVSVIGGIVAMLKILVPPVFKKIKDNWFASGKILKNSNTIKEIQKMNQEQALILLLILDHIIDGNNVEDIKKTRRKFKEYLFEEEKKKNE